MTAKPKREKISAVDTAWLRMDRPQNLMMICGVLILGERLTVDRLRATLSDRFLRFRRFRQRAVQSPTGAYWVDDAAFDIAEHVRRVKLPGTAGKFIRVLPMAVSRSLAAFFDSGELEPLHFEPQPEQCADTGEVTSKPTAFEAVHAIPPTGTVPAAR